MLCTLTSYIGAPAGAVNRISTVACSRFIEQFLEGLWPDDTTKQDLIFLVIITLGEVEFGK